MNSKSEMLLSGKIRSSKSKIRSLRKNNSLRRKIEQYRTASREGMAKERLGELMAQYERDVGDLVELTIDLTIDTIQTTDVPADVGEMSSKDVRGRGYLEGYLVHFGKVAQLLRDLRREMGDK